MKQLSINSETGRLKKVVIGYAENLHAIPPETVNETQRRLYFGARHPNKEKIIGEYAGFRKSLEARGVEVLQPTPEADITDQLAPRDIAFTIGDTLVLARMAHESRRHEWKQLDKVILAQPHDKVIWPPEGALIEGGDVTVDRGRVYIGIGQRTTAAGAKFIADKFPDREVVVIDLSKLSDGEDVIHLDCVFAPVGHESALIYRPGIKNIPDCILKDYDLIDITRDEQAELAPNVLSISPKEIISMPKFSRMNEELNRRGMEVVEVEFSETIKTGGSFHCGSVPLVREDA